MMWAAACALITLVALPALGMYFAYSQPPGLIEPPPLEWSRIWPLVLRTLGLAALVSVFSLVAGTLLGYAHARTTYPGRQALGLLSILPLAIPSYLIAAIVRVSMSPNGTLGFMLGREGSFSGFWPAVLVLTVACTPYVQILVAAHLERYVGPEDEAARSLGASAWRRFRCLHIPRLRPTWSFALVLVSLYVISDFGAVAILDCRVLTWELYQARGARDAVLLGFAIMACVVPLLAGIRLLAGHQHLRRQLGRGRAPHREQLSLGGRVIVYVLHAAIIGIGIALPTWTLLRWVQAGIVNQTPFAPLVDPTLTTAIYTLVGASFTLLCAALPAWVVARSSTKRIGAWMEHATYLTSAVPGILLAFGMLHLTLGLKRYLP